MRDQLAEKDGKPQIHSVPESHALDYEDELFVSKLLQYGLTSNQARIYLFLLGRKPVSASVISKELGLHRVDVYRKLRELRDLGIVDVHLDSPKRYEAIDPDAAISALLGRMESKIHSLQNYSEDLRTNLRQFQVARRANDNEGSLSTYSDGLYKLVTGRERYYYEMSKLVRNAKFEVLRILSSGGLVRTFLPEGLYREYVRARARGISLRMISEVDSKNRPYAKRLSEVLELRHLENVHLRFTVVDRSVTILSARFDEGDMSIRSSSDNYLLVSDSKFAELSCFFFEHLWAISSDWREAKAKRSS